LIFNYAFTLRVTGGWMTYNMFTQPNIER
jgi:hypothetical protein